MTADLAKLEAESPSLAALPELNEKVAALAAKVARAEADLASAEAEEMHARTVEAERREIAAQAKLKAQEFETELATLLKLLEPDHKGDWSPIIGQVHIEAGYESAIAAALGDDLDAANDESAPAYWRLTKGDETDRLYHPAPSRSVNS